MILMINSPQLIEAEDISHSMSVESIKICEA